MNTTEKKEKVRLAELLGLAIPPARVRSAMDKAWINRKTATSKNELQVNLDKIRKEGCPVPKPVAPKKLVGGYKVKESERRKYKELKAEYDAKLKEWDAYVSPRFTQLKLLNTYCKKLRSLHQLLKKKQSDSTKYEIAAILAVLNDKPAPKKPSETEESYEARVKRFKPKGFTSVRGDIALDKPTNIEEELKRVADSNPGLELFSAKDNLSKKSIRFSQGSAVVISVVMESLLEQLIDHTLEVTLDVGKKTLQPGYCATDGIEKYSLFTLMENVPHYRALLERQLRKEEWATKRSLAKQKLILEHKKAVSKGLAERKRPVFEYPSFQQTEVDNGYALKVEPEEGKDKPSYLWYGIDVERDGNTRNKLFQFYVNLMCKKAIAEEVTTGNLTAPEDMRVGAGFKKFLADIVGDFITRVTPIIMLFLENSDTKTVSAELMASVIKVLLLDSYQEKTETTELSEEHQQIFNSVAAKLALLKDHNTDLLDDLDEEELNGSALNGKGHLKN